MCHTLLGNSVPCESPPGVRYRDGMRRRGSSLPTRMPGGGLGTLYLLVPTVLCETLGDPILSQQNTPTLDHGSSKGGGLMIELMLVRGSYYGGLSCALVMSIVN